MWRCNTRELVVPTPDQTALYEQVASMKSHTKDMYVGTYVCSVLCIKDVLYVCTYVHTYVHIRMCG